MHAASKQSHNRISWNASLSVNTLPAQCNTSITKVWTATLSQLHGVPSYCVITKSSMLTRGGIGTSSSPTPALGHGQRAKYSCCSAIIRATLPLLLPLPLPLPPRRLSGGAAAACNSDVALTRRLASMRMRTSPTASLQILIQSTSHQL